jgi:hypothetical protein
MNAGVLPPCFTRTKVFAGLKSRANRFQLWA